MTVDKERPSRAHAAWILAGSSAPVASPGHGCVKSKDPKHLRASGAIADDRPQFKICVTSI